MALFDVIHVSDFHFGRPAGRPNLATLANNPGATLLADEAGHALRTFFRQATHDPALAIQVARFLIERVEPETLLLLSGDISATGTVDDLEVGLSFLEATPGSAADHLDRRLRPTIAAGRLNICLVPGNHDRYADHLGRPGSKNFDVKFANYWGKKDKVVGFKIVTDPDTGVKLAVVTADMCLEAEAFHWGSTAHYGHGCATPEIVKKILKTTSNLREQYPEIGICWMLHFPPSLVKGDVPSSLRLENDNLVIDAAICARVRLILAGHTHVSMVREVGSLTIACAGSATFYLQSGGHYIHHLKIEVEMGEAVLKSRTDYRWDILRAEFSAV